MKKSICAYCKENFSLLDFTNNQRTTINIKLENNTIQDIYLHDNCKEEYIKENNIFYCVCEIEISQSDLAKTTEKFYNMR